jgi:hypothetical protein
MPQYSGQQYNVPGYVTAVQPAPAVPEARDLGDVHTAFFSNILFTIPLEEFSAFARGYGEIARLNSLIPTKGFAFVTYFDIRDAQKAVEQANNRLLHGRAVRTRYAVQPPYAERDPKTSCSSVLVRPVMRMAQIAAVDIYRTMAVYGEIRAVNQLEFPGHFVVKFFDIRAAERACQAGKVECGNQVFLLEYRMAENEMQTPVPQQPQTYMYPYPQQQYATDYPLPVPQPPVSADFHLRLQQLKAILQK